MVLQREKPINIWGWADAGDTILVSFAGQSKRATADRRGQWTLSLDAMAASSEGRVMTVSSSKSKQKIQINDVLVGEVWLCSGQSNMSYSMSRFGNCAKEVPQMKYPQIRHFSVFYTDRAIPQEDVFGAWAVCSPETAMRFSATALYYAVELHKALNVPIGLLNSSVGGTTAEQWSDIKTLEANPDIKSQLEKRKTVTANPELMARYEKALTTYLDVVGVNVESVNEEKEKAFIEPDLSDTLWKTIKPPHSTGNGVAWFARELTLPNDMLGKKLTLNIGAVGRERTTYWNGIKLGSQRIHTIPASRTQHAKNLLSIRAAGIRGGGMSGVPSLNGPDGTTLSLSDNAWKLHLYAVEPKLPKEISTRGTPSGLYNGMIHPLIPYSFRGVIWYQGENNHGGYPYRKVIADMIQAWRKNWGQGDFPFYFCQLANYHPKQHAVASNHSWPLIREAQAMALALPNTGMACLIDIGKYGTYERDIHPANNQDQGKRLALIARDKIYGEDIISSGPMFDSMSIKGNKITVKFKSVGSGLLRGGIKGWYDHTIIRLPTHPPGKSIHGFTIAGADGDFRMAHASISGKDTVVIWHEKIPNPKNIRFAWHRNPLHNLYNKDKLPAPPFRTDDIDLR